MAAPFSGGESPARVRRGSIERLACVAVAVAIATRFGGGGLGPPRDSHRLAIRRNDRESAARIHCQRRRRNGRERGDRSRFVVAHGPSRVAVHGRLLDRDAPGGAGDCLGSHRQGFQRAPARRDRRCRRATSSRRRLDIPGGATHRAGQRYVLRARMGRWTKATDVDDAHRRRGDRKPPIRVIPHRDRRRVGVPRRARKSIGAPSV